MSNEKPLIRRIKAPLWLMILTILISFLAPTVLALPEDPSKRHDSEMAANTDIAYNFEAYFAIVNYNEPSNPWVQINYYYENGSYITMIFGIDRTLFPTLNLNYQGNFIQVFDRKGKLSGYGIRTKMKSNLFVYVSA